MPRTIFVEPARVNPKGPAILAAVVVLSAGLCVTGQAQTQKAAAGKAEAQTKPSRTNILRGEYGPLRANNDLLYYHLDVRVDPEKETISGKNTIRFRMLKDDTRIQLDLNAALAVDKILLGEAPLKFEREAGAVFVDFPGDAQGRARSARSISTIPESRGPGGGSAASRSGRTRRAGPGFIRSCEMQGASVWWPNKDQWRDKVESMDLSVTIPNDLVDVSNGRFVGKKDLGDGSTRWDWHVSYPINNYCVSLNIGKYEHFTDKLGDLTSISTRCRKTWRRPRSSSPRPRGCSKPFSTTSANIRSRTTATS